MSAIKKGFFDVAHYQPQMAPIIRRRNGVSGNWLPRRRTISAGGAHEVHPVHL
jgi:hypothetical protein